MKIRNPKSALLGRQSRTIRNRYGFSLLEMLATVAALVIVLGLMVSLARYVRRRASDQLTKQVLAQLDQLMQHYKERNGGMLPDVPPFVAPPSPLRSAPSSPALLAASENTLPKESELQRSAKANNQAFVAALRVEARRRPAEFSKLPQLFLEGDALPDAWGTPIVFMPSLHPDVGMAMENKPFFRLRRPGPEVSDDGGQFV